MVSTALLFGANLLPLAGIYLWGWDAFSLLMLYWLETAVIAFWVILQVVVRPRGMDNVPGPKSPLIRSILRGVFLSIHAALFMSVHFMFLWSVFGGEWKARVHDAHDFVQQLVIGEGLWIPLALMFAVRGVSAVMQMTGEDTGRSPLRDLYGRVAVLQVAIILGAGVLTFFQHWPAAGVLVAIKTVIELVSDGFAARRRPP